MRGVHDEGQRGEQEVDQFWEQFIEIYFDL